MDYYWRAIVSREFPEANAVKYIGPVNETRATNRRIINIREASRERLINLCWVLGIVSDNGLVPNQQVIESPSLRLVGVSMRYGQYVKELMNPEKYSKEDLRNLIRTKLINDYPTIMTY